MLAVCRTAVLGGSFAMPGAPDMITQMALDRYTVAIALDGGAKNQRLKRIKIWNTILDLEITTGSTFLVAMPEGIPYLFVGLTRDTFPIPRSGRGGERFWSYMNRRFGLSDGEANNGVSRYILEQYRNYALTEGLPIELRRFAAYRERTAYLASRQGMMWRVDGENIMPIDNGEDGVFFADINDLEPQVGANGVLFPQLIDTISFAEAGMGGITAEQMRRAYIVWIFALAFPDLMPTKPLLIMEGSPGAGKTAALNLLQIALLGESKPIALQRSREDDFGVLLLRAPICVFDNLDAYIDWLPDAICAYTTGGMWTKRKLFTDSEEVTIKPKAFIAIASKNPASFRREDVADRCIVLRLERRVDSKSFQDLRREIEQLRPQIFGEYLYYVNRIVAEIRAGALDDIASEQFRMADFATFARIVARVLEWEEDAVDELLSAIQGEQAAFINEEDPLIDVLYKWIDYAPKNGPRNVGRDVPINTLFHELESIAQSYSITFYKSARMLAQKLRSPHIERDFIVQMLAPDGHKSYRIWRKTDPRLTVVPMPSEDEESPITSADDGG